MARGLAFADVLDEKLGAMHENRGRTPQPTYRRLPPEPFLFAHAHRPFRVAPAYGTAGPSSELCATLDVAAARVEPPVVARATRELTSRQRSALNALRSRGIPLGPDFTARELRSAFRSLACRHHPDRYPGKTQLEAERLGREFAEIAADYRALLTVFDRIQP